MVGIGFRKDFAEAFLDEKVLQPDFIEVAPENWMGVGGFWKKKLKKATEEYPLFVHGLSLSVGSPDAIDFNFLKRVKQFLDEHNVVHYSEHLSFSKCNNAHLYDLLPIPFTEDAVNHISEKIRRVQDVLERKLAIEIVSYYTPIATELSESSFINEVTKQSDCQLLLDVNNIYVNGFNHNYDPKVFIDKIDLSNVAYIHMAGHEQVSPDLIIDTHGQPIIDPVYDLLEYSLQKLEKSTPILLERDFNIPELQELQLEVERLQSIVKNAFVDKVYAA